MQSGNSEEHLICANSSTKQTAMHKCCNASSSLLGLLTKRSIRVEPHPQVLDIDCPERSTDESHLQVNDVSFAKRSLEKAENIKTKSPQPARRQPPSDLTNINRILEKSHSSGLITSSGNLPLVDKGGDIKIQRSNRDGTQSDGDGKSSDDISIKLRKHVKHRSPNHNRFSHQFSLCCKVEKKSLTPPITVRYNSMQNNTQMLKKSGMSLNLNPAENIPIATVRSVSSTNYSSQPPNSNKITECASAPQSPVSAKVATFGTSPLAHGSPSNFSLKYRSNVSCNDGPIRPLAVSDCRSRLRQKLYPHGKDGIAKPESVDSHQHNSSPNIAVPVEVPETTTAETERQPMRFSSYENIQLHRQGSSSGLARQALMAAQVLSLIPTDKVKDRSLMDGRLGSCSLLGPSELNRLIPTKEITIFVGTWNMNGQSPPKQMNDFVLPAPVEHMPDIVAIGTQESSPDRFEWEASLQETLGPSHVLFHSTTLGTLHLAIYMRRDLIWYCSVPEDASMSVRTGSAFRTKGAVAISFCLFGTSMLFVTSHLTAHHQKVKERVSDVKRIIHALDLPRNLNLRYKNKDVTQNFDDVFWCGDLNFRLAEPREKLLEWIQKTKFPLPSHLPHGYMHTDQLSSVLAEGAAFRGFMEANITFPPTYKYDPGTQNFDTSSKQRAPAYTDRILYKYRQMQGIMMRRTSTLTGMNTPPISPHIECLLYDSVPSITTSDHKPVWALFKAIIRAGTDSIPLAGGLFSRDIYLEGIKRRMKNQYSGSSVVCSIQ